MEAAYDRFDGPTSEFAGIDRDRFGDGAQETPPARPRDGGKFVR